MKDTKDTAPAGPRLKILVALDGSGGWTRTVGYLSRFTSTPGMDVLLYHVLELDTSSRHTGSRAAAVPAPVRTHDDAWLAERRADIEREVLEPAREALEAASLHGHLRIGISTSVETRARIAQDIIAKARSEGFDTVVLERRMAAAGHGRRLGRIATTILKELQDRAVWVLE